MADQQAVSSGGTRTILVHLNVQVPAGADITAQQIADDVKGALAVGADNDWSPALAQCEVDVALAEEV